MARKYVVIDTNVLVSALITRNENSPTVQILHFLAKGNIVPVYSDEIVKEQHAKMPRPFVLTNCQQERPCAVCGKVVMMIRRQKYCPACSILSKTDRAKKAAVKGSI